MTLPVKNSPLVLFSIYFSLSFRPSLPTEILGASYHNQTKLSPVYLTFIHVYGEAKNSKKVKCLHFNCYMLRTFRSWYSLSLYARRFVKTRITEQRSVDKTSEGLG